MTSPFGIGGFRSNVSGCRERGVLGAAGAP